MGEGQNRAMADNITLADACEQARQNNVHRKQIGFALVVVYERDSDRPFVKVAAKTEEGDVKLATLLGKLGEQYKHYLT
jgi:hypothetical protein